MSGKPVLPSSRHRAMSSSILHSASAPNVWLFDLSRDIGVRESGTAESAERIHEVKRSWLDCFGNGQLHIVHADTGELIGRTGPQGSRCGVRTPEAVAEQRQERDWKRTEEMQHNAHGYDVKLSGS